MKPLSRRERIRLWLWTIGDDLGLMLAAGLALVLGGLGLFMTLPVGPPTTVVGVIVGMSSSQSDYGAFPRALVQLPVNGVHSMGLLRGSSCAVGDPVVVVETPKVWGVDRHISPVGCNR